MRYCSTCGQPNADDTGLCQRCAVTTARRCPACDRPAPQGNRFCIQCGTSLENGGAVPSGQTRRPPTGPLSARREVTVLFLDVTNFTAASHGLDSEDVFAWIDETMRLLASVVRKYEGTIDKFTGDGLMALFGAPEAHENDPERAVRAALEMQQIVRPLRERILRKHGFDFQMRIGLNTGTVVAGSVGGDFAEYTVLGDTVNLASRLEKAAEPGSILVSEATYQRTRPLFEYAILPSLYVKGMPEPIQSYRPMHLRQRPGTVRGIPGLHVPMIGRERPLERLSAAFDDVIREGQNRIALITGEAGLGKSRLITEFRALLTHADVRFYVGSCLAYARSTPLWVLADILRDILHVSAVDPGDIQREALRAYLSQIGLADQETLPYLANVLGLGQTDRDTEARLRLMDASMLQRQTHSALRQIFLAEARRGPTVLVFEDLHWVDPASRDFLEYLLPAVGTAPLLVLLVSRDSERQSVVQPLVAAANRLPERLYDIKLQALSDTEGELLVGQIIREDTPATRALKRRIAERAGGIPFYIEEIVRILLDNGGLTNMDGAWQVTLQADALLGDVPDTLKGLILTRFDHLPDDLRQTLQQAAVLGRSFPANLLQILVGADPVTMSAQFAELVSRQFLIPEPFGWAQGYAFRHVLIQEAISGTLLKRDRQPLHTQVAQLIERAAFWPRDEQVEVLAYHYAESDRPAKAIVYLLTAAENAARRYANETAIHHYRRAIEIIRSSNTTQLDDCFRAQLGLGQALKFIGQFAEASQTLTEAIASLQAHPDARHLALRVNLLRELADIRQRERAYDDAVAHLQVALQALGERGQREEPVLWRSATDRLAWIRFRQGRLDEALALAQAAIEGVQTEYCDDPITLASLCNTIGGVFWQRGALADATVYVEHSLQLYKDLNYAWGVAIAHTNLGVLYYARRMWPQAAESLERASEIRRQHGYLPDQAINLYNLGMLRIEMGEHEQANRHLEESLSISRQLRDDVVAACSISGLLRLAIIRNDPSATTLYAEQAEQLLTHAPEDEAILIHTLLAQIATARGNAPRGLQRAAEGLRIARAASKPEQESDCLRVLGILHARIGETAEAEHLFQQALIVSSDRADEYRQGLALIELGLLFEQRGNLEQALDYYGKAKLFFDQLGAKYDLQQALTACARCQKSIGVARELIAAYITGDASSSSLPEKEVFMSYS